MKKVLAAVFGLAVVGGITALVVAFATPSSANLNPTETTVDIGAQWDPYAKDGSLTTATFSPTLSAADAMAKAKAELKARTYVDADEMGLPVRTTIGLFTGVDQTKKGGPWVTNLKARVVVFDNIPDAPVGPAMPDSSTSPANAPAYTGIARVTMVFDDATGRFVYGVWAGVPSK